VKLVDDILAGYNSLIRPVENITTKVKVEIQLALIQIIDVVCTQQAPPSRVGCGISRDGPRGQGSAI